MTRFRKHYADTSYGQIHGRSLACTGEATHVPLVCLHPAPASGLYYTTVMPLLNAGRNVYAPDYQGYGGSDGVTGSPTIEDYAKAMHEYLDGVEISAPVDLLGFHTGCLVANEMALQHPEKVRRIVLCDVPYFTADRRPAMRDQNATPMPISESLESIAGAWKFNISNRIGHADLVRSFDLLAEHLRSGTDDYRAFYAAFSYDCENRFAQQQADTVLLATQSGLLEPTRAVRPLIPGARYVEALDIKASVFESGANSIAKHILNALD